MPKDRGAEPRDFAVPWNAVWLWGWYRLRHDCVLLCPKASSERTMRDMLYKKTEDWQTSDTWMVTSHVNRCWFLTVLTSVRHGQR